MKLKILFLISGLLLVLGFFTTTQRELDDETQAIIDEAIRMDHKIDLWPGYNLENFPIDINYGKEEFRYYKGTTTSQKPTIEVLALSAIQEEDGPVIKVLPEDMVRKMTDIAGDTTPQQRKSQYISILFHEGLHAFQFTKGMGENWSNLQGDSKGFDDLLIILDEDEMHKSLWIKEAEALVDFLETGDHMSWIQAYNAKIDYMAEKLGDDFETYMYREQLQEIIEGTARYVEEKVLTHLTGSKSNKNFDGIYRKGTEKFYYMGALKSQILDNVSPNWKEGFFESQYSLTERILADKME